MLLSFLKEKKEFKKIKHLKSFREYSYDEYQTQVSQKGKIMLKKRLRHSSEHMRGTSFGTTILEV
jgi:hypothetical protein